MTKEGGTPASPSGESLGADPEGGKATGRVYREAFARWLEGLSRHDWIALGGTIRGASDLALAGGANEHSYNFVHTELRETIVQIAEAGHGLPLLVPNSASSEGDGETVKASTVVSMLLYEILDFSGTALTGMASLLGGEASAHFLNLSTSYRALLRHLYICKEDGPLNWERVDFRQSEGAEGVFIEVSILLRNMTAVELEMPPASLIRLLSTIARNFTEHESLLLNAEIGDELTEMADAVAELQAIRAERDAQLQIASGDSGEAQDY